MEHNLQKDAGTEGIRLNKYISESGCCSRREADRLIEQGAIRIDGQTAQMGVRVFPGQQVTVNGRILTKEEEKILLAFHKPRGVVCTTDTRWGDVTVEELLHYPRRVFSIGRLDKDSEGLLLMTNQGDILNKILKAGNAHEKEYLVTIDREVTKDMLETLSKGIYLEELGVRTKPCRAEKTAERQFRIILTQGLNRQIRRMCQAVGCRVVRLVRLRVMNIELGDLKPGEYRSVTGEELARMNQLLQGSSNHPVQREYAVGERGADRRGPSGRRTNEQTDRHGPSGRRMNEQTDRHGPSGRRMNEQTDRRGPAEKRAGEQTDRRRDPAGRRTEGPARSRRRKNASGGKRNERGQDLGRSEN